MKKYHVTLLKFSLWSIISVGLLRCSHDRYTANSTETTSSGETTDRPEAITQDSGNQNSLIQGLWATSEDANASFRVKGDSLYFFEDSGSVLFEVKSDSFIYYLDGVKFYNKILKLQSDSIVFIENGELIKLYNRETRK
jgi:hypothetical protein